MSCELWLDLSCKTARSSQRWPHFSRLVASAGTRLASWFSHSHRCLDGDDVGKRHSIVVRQRCHAEQWSALDLTSVMPSKAKHAKTAKAIKPETKTETQELPKNWPEDVQFLTHQTYSTAVTAENRAALSRSTPDSASFAQITAEALKEPCPQCEIQIITSEKHPAFGQRGLFAAQHLEPNSFICVYVGHVHTNSLSDTDPHSDYDLNYDSGPGLSIDAARCGNEARFTNDFRGIAERPNSEFRDCFVQVTSEKRVSGTKWERRVGIFVLSAGNAGHRKGGIKAGEEILVTYGKGYWEGRKTLATFRKDEEMCKLRNQYGG